LLGLLYSTAVGPFRKLLALLGAASVAMLAACDDDGEGVRDAAGGSASGSASGSPSASASASGSAIQDVAAAGTDDPMLLEAVAGYRQYVVSQVDEAVSDTKRFTEAIRSGDLDAAKAQYARSRESWKRVEPVAALIPALAGKLDARVDDFSGPDDPAWTGWHRLEYDLWETGEITDGTKAMADQLAADLAALQAEVAELEIPAAAIAVGAAELIEEAASGKLTGEEDRFSKTDLWDIAANVEGSQEAFEFLEPKLEEVDAELADTIEARFDEADELLAGYAEGDGYRPFTDVSAEDLDRMKAALAELAEQMSQVAGTLGLT
jgi:iron uptake system component EfeO